MPDSTIEFNNKTTAMLYNTLRQQWLNHMVRSCGMSHVIPSSESTAVVFQRFVIKSDSETFYFEMCTFCDFQKSDPIFISESVAKSHVYFAFRLYNNIQLKHVVKLNPVA